MHRAYVGFSSPIGYDYENPANKVPNDQSSSPNPILMAGVGLICLYDEIWFACESLCPANLRGREFVHYLDRDKAGMSLDDSDLEINTSWESCEALGLRSESIGSLYDGSLDPSAVGYLANGVDNHTHEISFFGSLFRGNPGIKEVAADLWILGKYKELEATLVANPLTENILSRPADASSVNADFSKTRLAHNVITINDVFDIRTKSGPFHDCLMELRQEPEIKSFRKWISGDFGSFDNMPPEEIARTVRSTVVDFQRNAVSKVVKKESLLSLTLGFAKDYVADLVPMMPQALKIIEAIGKNSDVSDVEWKAFLAKAHADLEIETSMPPKKNLKH